MGALHGVGTVQRLVEHEDCRIADECGRDFRPLAHALAEAVDATVGDVEHVDLGQRAVRRATVGQHVQVCHVTDQLPTR